MMDEHTLYKKRLVYKDTQEIVFISRQPIHLASPLSKIKPPLLFEIISLLLIINAWDFTHPAPTLSTEINVIN